MIAEDQRDFPTAEAWYRKSLAISEKEGNEHGAAATCHELGITAQAQRDFPTAEVWYRKSLAIREKVGDEHGAARIYQSLGNVASGQRDFYTAEAWYPEVARHHRKARRRRRGIPEFMRTNDQRFTQAALGALLDCYQRAPDNDKQGILALWKQTGLGPFPEISDD